MVSSRESQHVFIDVDDTLVMWKYPVGEPIENLVEIKACAGEYPGLFLKRHERHIEDVIKYKLKGHTVIVWSAGGANWAKCVVQALKLEKYVDFTLSKPNIYYDDCKSEHFMPENVRFYFEDKE